MYCMTCQMDGLPVSPSKKKARSGVLFYLLATENGILNDVTQKCINMDACNQKVLDMSDSLLFYLQK